MRQWAKGLTFALTALVMSACLPIPAMAAGNTVNFSVTPKLPENQRGGTTGYFDLIVDPGQMQELTIEVLNQADEEIVVEVEAVTASTNSNGMINYTTPGEHHASMPHMVSELMAVEEPVLAVPAHSSRTVSVALSAPDRGFDGYLLGSIHIKRRLSEAELGSGQSILNQYSYVIAVKVAVSEVGVENDFALEGVEAQLVNGKASVVNRIVNPAPVMVKGMDTTVKIFPKGSGTPIMERHMEATDMAPNSVFPFTLVDDAGYGVRAGTYLSRVEIVHKDKVWDFEQEFVIKAEQAAQINSEAVNLTTRQTAMAGVPAWMTMTLIVAIALLLLLAAALLCSIRRSKSGGDGSREPS